MDFDFQSLSQEEFEEDMKKQNMISHSTFVSGIMKSQPKNSFEDLLIDDKSISDSPFNLFSDNNSVVQAPLKQHIQDPLFSPAPILPHKDFMPELIFKNDFPVIEKKVALVKTEQKSKKTSSTCKCKNSNCLRLHCSCFKNLGYCSDECRCFNCLNKKDFKQARQFVIKKTKRIYKKAFEKKHVIIKGVKINKDGCNCSKSCSNLYCGCKKVNGKCSPICRCVNCQNGKINLSKEEIQSFYKPCSRKKDKIIINYHSNEKQESIDKSKNIIYQTYKKFKSND